MSTGQHTDRLVMKEKREVIIWSYISTIFTDLLLIPSHRNKAEIILFILCSHKGIRSITKSRSLLSKVLSNLMIPVYIANHMKI